MGELRWKKRNLKRGVNETKISENFKDLFQRYWSYQETGMLLKGGLLLLRPLKGSRTFPGDWHSLITQESKSVVFVEWGTVRMHQK